METEEYMIPVSEYASSRGMTAGEVIEAIQDGTYGYRGKQDAQGNWTIDSRSPFMVTSVSKQAVVGTPLISTFLHILAWLALGAGGFVFAQLMDTPGGEFVGGVILASSVVSFALFSALANGLTYLCHIEANTKKLIAQS